MKMCAREPFKSAVYKGAWNCRNGLPGRFIPIVRWRGALSAFRNTAVVYKRRKNRGNPLSNVIISGVSRETRDTLILKPEIARRSRKPSVRMNNVERHSILLSLDDVFTVHSHCRLQKYTGHLPLRRNLLLLFVAKFKVSSKSLRKSQNLLFSVA